MLSDINMNADMIRAADVHSGSEKAGNTLFYIYDRQLSLSSLSANRRFDGTAHAEELAVVFGFDKAIGESIESTADTNGSMYEDPATVQPPDEISRKHVRVMCTPLNPTFI